MILGILSDTHGRGAVAEGAVRKLCDAGAQFLIHCGDVGSRAVLDALAGGDPPAAVVWGNTDHDRDELASYASALSIRHDHPVLRLELGGRRIAVTHGDNGRVVDDVLARGGVDLLLVGHTHVPGEETRDGVRIINPGALHRAVNKTVATLDLSSGKLQWIRVEL